MIFGPFYPLRKRPGFSFYRKTGPLYVYKYTDLSCELDKGKSNIEHGILNVE